MYFVALNNEKAGPFTLAQLQEMWRAGTVRAQTLFWEQGMADWQPLDHAAAARLGLPDHDSLRFAPPGFAPVVPAASDPLSPPATSHEPSAYDLPAERLPAAPVPVTPPAPAPPAMPVAVAVATPDAPRPEGLHSLIAPTRLPSAAGAGVIVPAASLAYPPLTNPANQVPTVAYVSLGCAAGWPVLLFLHGIGWLVSLAMMIAAVICGHAARTEIRRSGNRLPGMGIATTGLVLGYVSLAFAVVMILIVLLGIFLVVLGISQGHH